MNDRKTQHALFLTRVTLGFCFVMHGLQKVFGIMGGKSLSEFGEIMQGLGVPMPTVMAYVTAFGELAGGIALVVGFFSKFASVLIILLMAGAIYYVHGRSYFMQSGGMEYNLALIAMSSCILLAGPGSFAYRIEKNPEGK